MRTAIAFILASLLGSSWAVDTVYRWVDKDGVVHYGARPPSKDAQPASLPEIQTYSHRAGSRAVPVQATDSPSASKGDSAVAEVRILAPVQDEVFRDPQGVVNVTAAVLPTLPDGAGVIFYLDGAAKNAKPLASTSMTFTGVERGEHTVTVAVVDASGKELKRALAVTFHNKPPTVK